MNVDGKEPDDGIRKAKLEAMSIRLKADVEEATRNRLVWVSVSKRRFILVGIDSPVPKGGKMIFSGQIVFGPAAEWECSDYILSL